jgi:predicted RNA binding protein YcfA (HicA-like mRNA interferase family)
MVMGEKDLINKFLNDQTHITIDACNTLLNTYGYRLKKGSGSHRIYHKNNARAITIVAPHGTKYVKSVYIKIIIKLLGLEGKSEY